MLDDLRARLLALSDDVSSRPDRLFSSALDLYEGVRIDGTALEEDGDMLLFQWGSYDWGQGRHFDLDLTRQAIPSGQEDPPILQLHCTYRYDPGQFADIVAGNRWCSTPGGADEFRQFVLNSGALQRAKSHAHVSLEIWLDDAE